MLKFKNLSNNIYSGGKILLLNGKNLTFIKKNKQTLISLFEKNGIIVFRDLDISPKEFKNLADIFSSTYANDAARREKTSYHQNVNSVDIGSKKMSLHSEASFSPSWPEILWFFCIDAPKNKGETTICDGLKLWKNFNNQTKEFFLKNPIKFSLSIPVLNSKKKDGKKKYWPLNNIGSYNSYLDYKTGKLEFEQIKFAINESRIPNQLCFANHVMYKDTDETIKNWGLLNNKKLPKNLLNYVEEEAEKITVYHKWKKNDIMMLDNKRFLHGRNSFEKKEKRKIINIQTLKANFSYGSTSNK
jgi:alpha-ketoglutarate-dependent taurine dioxygenase